jgi:8-oxo-dGTP diphosphatase
MAQTNQYDRQGHGVVVACQREDGRWLLIRRSASVRAPLRVCFPGGWIDEGESQEAAAVREMREELAAEVHPVRCVWQHRFAERSLILWGWLAELKSPTLIPNPLEVHEILWLTVAEVIRHADVLPHTDAFIAALLQA